MYIYNAKIFTGKGFIANGWFSVEDGFVTDVGEGLPPSVASGTDINCGGRLVTPGFIDAHTHLGLSADGVGVEGDDFNEDSDPATPHLRVIDAIDPMQSYFRDAVRNGVTAVAVSPGSTNPIGGGISVISTCGRRVDDMLIADVGIKFALGENPKGTFSEKDAAPVTRMATAAVIREALEKARRYMRDIENAEDDSDLPDLDQKCEALIPLLTRRIKAHFHCHQANDIFTAIRIAKEYSLDYVLIHCTEGHLIADILGEEEVSAVVGPILSDHCKPELKNSTPENAAVLAQNGVKIAICTDHSEIPINYLPLSAAVCVKHGLSHEAALTALTSAPAEILGIAKRKGSIAAGRDADFVIWEGDPLDIRSNAAAVYIEGVKVYGEE